MKAFTFLPYFLLNLSIKMSRVIATSAKAETAAPEGREGMTKGKMLIVDADKKTFEGVEALVEKGDLEACYATSAEEAWGFLMDGGVSLMLINPSIPGVNGYILASMAKDLYPDVSAVMLTERVTQLCAPHGTGSRTAAKAEQTSSLEALAPREKEEAREPRREAAVINER
jgi:DNA-binding NtrC family response regulator